MKKSLLPIFLLAALAIASCGKKTDTAMTDSTKMADSATMAPAAAAMPGDTINRHPANPPTGGRIGPPQKSHPKVTGVPGSLAITAPANTGSFIQLNTQNGMQPDSVWVTATFTGPDFGTLNISSMAWHNGSQGYGCGQVSATSCSIEFAMPAAGSMVNVNAGLNQSGWSSVSNKPNIPQNGSGSQTTTYVMGPDTCVVNIWDTGVPVQQPNGPGGGPNVMTKKK